MTRVNDFHEPLPSDVLAGLPPAEAMQARREAAESVGHMLEECGIIETACHLDDVSSTEFDWDRVRVALLGDLTEHHEFVAADDIDKILALLADGDFGHAEDLAGELLAPHRDTLLACASRAFRWLDRRRAHRKVAHAIQRYSRTGDTEPDSANDRFLVLLTSLAFFARHGRAQCRLGQPACRQSVKLAIGEACDYHTS